MTYIPGRPIRPGINLHWTLASKANGKTGRPGSHPDDLPTSHAGQGRNVPSTPWLPGDAVDMAPWGQLHRIAKVPISQGDLDPAADLHIKAPRHRCRMGPSLQGRPGIQSPGKPGRPSALIMGIPGFHGIDGPRNIVTQRSWRLRKLDRETPRSPGIEVSIRSIRLSSKVPRNLIQPGGLVS